MVCESCGFKAVKLVDKRCGTCRTGIPIMDTRKSKARVRMITDKYTLECRKLALSLGGKAINGNFEDRMAAEKARAEFIKRTKNKDFVRWVVSSPAFGNTVFWKMDLKNINPESELSRLKYLLTKTDDEFNTNIAINEIFNKLGMHRGKTKEAVRAALITCKCLKIGE